MQTYTTRYHRILDLCEMTEEQRVFFDRCYAAYLGGVPWLDLLRLIDGTENPLLRQTNGLITRDAWEHPLFQAIQDLADRTGVRQERLAAGDGDDVGRDPLEDTWIPIVDAAREKGVTVPGLHRAITRGDVIARPRKSNGSHLVVSSNSLARWQPDRARQAAARRRQPRAAVAAQFAIS